MRFAHSIVSSEQYTDSATGKGITIASRRQIVFTIETQTAQINLTLADFLKGEDMALQLLGIFFNVITPVFLLVAIGYFAHSPLGLNARTLSRFAYFILIPAFVFDVIRTTHIQASDVARMTGYIIVVHLALAAVGWGMARLLNRSPKMVAAYVLIAIFGNVGNFGLPLIEFRLGKNAIPIATVYFLAIMTVSFVVGVAAANWRNGSLKATLAVFKTPALLALIPAFAVNWFNIPLPLAVTRSTGLLAGAMIPTMLIALGVQLAGMKTFHFSSDVIISSGIRLLGGAALAALVAIPFGLTGIARGAGIFQSAMPAAVLTSIIAIEYDLLPDFVTTAVLFSTLASTVTLTLVMGVV